MTFNNPDPGVVRTVQSDMVKEPLTFNDRLGALSAVLGTLSAASYFYLIALTELQDFNPPNWVRIVGMVWMPIGWMGAWLAGWPARHGHERGLAITGMFLGTVSLVAFIVLMAMADY
jgi:hypothetical protein